MSIKVSGSRDYGPDCPILIGSSVLKSSVQLIPFWGYLGSIYL